MNTRMHLNESQVRGLIAHLQTWLKTGNFTGKGVINEVYNDFCS